MTMKIGWDENKIDSEKVLIVLKEYIEIYQKYNTNKDDVPEFNVFVKGLKDKIEKCLETKINLDLKWYVLVYNVNCLKQEIIYKM